MAMGTIRRTVAVLGLLVSGAGATPHAVEAQCAAGSPETIVVEPASIIMEETSPRSLVLVTVEDAGGCPVPWEPVAFEAADPGQVDFLFPEAVTDVDGVAVTVLERSIPPRLVDTSFTVRADAVTVGPIPVTGWNVITDGSPILFRAPPLEPFLGPVQHLIGLVFYFAEPLPLGFSVRAWSVDPRVAEPGVGVMGEVVDRRQELTFEVTGKQHGETTFVIETLDVGIYVARVEGDLAPRFLRGDIDGDGRRGITDPIKILLHLVAGATAPPCADAADSNDDGKVDLADAVHLLGYLFRGGEPPPGPFSSCGADPTGDGLDCRARGCAAVGPP
jgi:hypothetical protein